MVRFNITTSAGTYLSPLGKTAGDFNQIFVNAWLDYNDVSEILAKVMYDRSPNWGMTRYKTMNEIIAETEVWLITAFDTGTSIRVWNRFTGAKENLLIPAGLGGPVNKTKQDLRQLIGEIKELLRRRENLEREQDRLKMKQDRLKREQDRLKREQMNEQNEGKLQEIEEELRKRYKELWGEDERTQTDWMGCYIPRTGTILIKIDSVYRAADLFGCPEDLLFQKVLLHEFIHAALDLWPRDAAGNISYHKKEWKTADPYGESFNEESIDNAIVLRLYFMGIPGCYRDVKAYQDVKDYIEMQPYYYRRAVELDKSKKLLFLLRDLIAYKISAPVSTAPSTAKGGKYTYYVNGHIVASGRRAGIGAAAYEVFSTIIPTLTLSQVRALVKAYGPQFGSLPLFMDANSYKKSPNQKRYYKVPVRTKDGKDIYICSQWYDRHYNLLQDVVNAYPALFPGGIDRK